MPFSFAEAIESSSLIDPPRLETCAGLANCDSLSLATVVLFTVQDWIGKARDPAVAGALKKQTKIDRDLKVATADALKDLPETDLNA